jgi:hypothetical protein
MRTESSSRSFIYSLVLACCVMMIAASSAQAISLGVMWSGKIGESRSGGEWDVIKRSGSSVYRVGIFRGEWVARGAGFYDPIFRRAAENNVTVLPYLVNGGYPSEADPEFNQWKTFIAEVVKRYGYSGSFWSGKPYYEPVTAWELGNEPNLGIENFEEKVNGANYAKFLIAMSAVAKAASQEQSGGGTQVLMGGLYVSGVEPPAVRFDDFLDEAYSVPNFHAAFDGVSIHPYGFKKPMEEVEAGVKGARDYFDGLKDKGGKPLPHRSLWVTEMGWGVAGTGKPTVSEETQKTLLEESFNWIKSKATAYDIQSLIWYNLRDDDAKAGWEYHAGLLKGDRGARPAWYAFQTQTGASSWTPPPEELGFAADDDSASPHVVWQLDDTIDAFYRTSSGALGHTWKGSVSGWSSADLTAGGALGSVPHAIIQSNDTIDVFYRTASGGLGHTWKGTGGSWATGGLAGSVASDPHAVVQHNGTIDVFYRTPSGELGHNWYDVGGLGWQQGNIAAPVASDPYPVVQPNGTIDVFYRTPGGELGHSWKGVGGGWSTASLGGAAASDPTPIAQPNGTIDVFYRTPGGELGHAWKGSEGGWASGKLAGAVASRPQAVVQHDGTIDVFYRTPTGGLGHNWYAPCCGGWSQAVLSGSLAGDPYPVLQYDGTIDVFYATPSGELGHAWKGAGGSWASATLAVAGSVTAIPHAAVLADGTIDVLFRTASGGIGHNWYSPCCGGWSQGTVPGSPAIGLPRASTETATGVTSGAATLKGTVSTEGLATSYYFEYGASGAYGLKTPTQSAGSGAAEVAVSKALTGLAAGNTYHYRLVATTSEGTSYGSDLTFKTPGSIVGNRYLRNSNTSGAADLTFTYGSPGSVPVTGDWNGDGIDTPGIYQPETGAWHLRNSNTTGFGEISFQYSGTSGAIPVVGDWNNDGIDTPGVYQPETGAWHLRNSNTTGFADISFQYGGVSGMVPLVGDWNNDGIDTPGVYQPEGAEWALRNSNTTGFGDVVFQYAGLAGMPPVVGDWNGDGVDTPGVYAEATGWWYLRNSNSKGPEDITALFGGTSGATPSVGDWNADGKDTIGVVY